MNSTQSRQDAKAKNVFGEPLVACCFDPLTGYFRDGYCRTDRMDFGSHVVCAQVTESFLNFSANKGNDLVTPLPQYNFPGLKEGDFWCLCALRWREAEREGVAPKVKLEATHEKVLSIIPLLLLKQYAIDFPEN
ncbi:MAG: DUF2237 domain-containing protein [Gammaproteobacteria bacterium]|nr:DUF2237 domain-containing protein [Gammaproteobacteria bacterium]